MFLVLAWFLIKTIDVLTSYAFITKGGIELEANPLGRWAILEMGWLGVIIGIILLGVPLFLIDKISYQEGGLTRKYVLFFVSIFMGLQLLNSLRNVWLALL